MSNERRNSDHRGHSDQVRHKNISTIPQTVESEIHRLAKIRPNLELRAKIAASIRGFFEAHGSLEVETPSLVSAPGTDPNLDPLPSGDDFLITSPEFQMKRLMAAGYERVHQLCHCFRLGEIGHLHNPEFTLLEWYWQGASYLHLASELEELFCHIFADLGRPTKLPELGVDLSPPWQRLTVKEAFRTFAGWEPGPSPDSDRFFFDLVEKVEPNLGKGRPTFLMEYPASQAVLSRLHPTNPEVALRFELYVDGVELVNAFDELTDPDEQRRRFQEDNKQRARMGKKELPIDEGLLQALAHMPPTSGAALGFDRLVMLLSGASSISQVMSFSATPRE